MEERKIEIMMCDYSKSDLDRVGRRMEKRATDGRNWRHWLTENVLREK